MRTDPLAEAAVARLRAERDETLRALLGLQDSDCRFPVRWAGTDRHVNFLLRMFSMHQMDHLQHLQKLQRDRQRGMSEAQMLLQKAQALQGEMEALVLSLSDEEFVQPGPNEGDWLPQQIVEHLGDIERTSPQWHEMDGGRYIGTSVLVITKDPDSDWVNVGTYRVQVQDERTVSVFIEPGKHGNVIRARWWARGQSCPMAISCGQHPTLGIVASYATRSGESEYDLAGGWIGEPISVLRAPITGLPIPAYGEIVLEGAMPPPEADSRPEGPFGEWPGYYASNTRPEPVMHVQAVYHRNDPIITASPPLKPTYAGKQADTIRQAAAIWDQVEAAGVPGVRGVWMMEGGGSRFATVVSISQMHAGHAKMAGLVATGCRAGAYLGRMVIVVDDDIDITDPREVVWAMATRWDPKTRSDIIDDCWTGHIDPMLSPQKRQAHDLSNSRIIIYACKPYAWKDDFPAVSTISPELKAHMLAKWAGQLDFLSETER